MKNMLVGSVLSLVSATTMAKTIPAGTYQIDPTHSKVGFEVAHLVVSTVEGRFTQYDGSITIDPKLEKSKANLNINTASITTDNKDRDDHLRSPDFFDAAKYPKMTFVVTKIAGTPENLKLTGDLTLKGKTKSVTLDAQYLGEVNDPYGNHKIAFNAKGEINRKDFGLSWSNVVEIGPIVGDKVTLNLKIQAAKPIAK